MLFIGLPSGRHLSYVKPRIAVNDFGNNCITFMGTGNQKKWTRLESYGPKFVENIVQAVSRDILAKAMDRMCKQKIVAHIHDEVILECPKETKVEDICRQMSLSPEWLPDIELKADGYECEFYMKQ